MPRLLYLFIIALISGGCDLGSSAPANDAWRTGQDSLVVQDSMLARADTVLKRPDSVAVVDNTVLHDTVPMIPSREINTKGVQPDALVKFAETLKGVRYVYGSTNPKVGFDCSGFITYVFNHFGISVPRSSIEFTTVGKEINVAEAKRGDIILFTGTNPEERHVGHMGIVVSNSDTLRFIHSTSGKAMGVTTTPLSNYYESRFVKTIRVFPSLDK